jgi:aspartyl-tRNA(Asn)/glutamyl-tRNA(Gln) amidotransferase subunit C
MPKLQIMSKAEEKGITEERVKYIADLARLNLESKEVTRLAGELGKIIQYIDVLNELDTNNVEPTYSSLNSNLRLREDVVVPSMKRESLLSESPQHDEESVLVPVVIITE